MSGFARTRPQPAPARVLVTATDRRRARADELAAALPGLIGENASAQSVALPAAAAQVAAGGVSAIVVALDGRDVPTGLGEMLDAAELARVPALMLIDDSGRRRAGTESVAVERLDAPAELIAAGVRGMLSRQAEVERLNHELAIATRFTGGLRSEIARMQEELQLASHVQREFLPRGFPALGSVRVDAFWRPASYVSGDIYDVIRLDERHIGVFIADAVGHGVPAALLTMVICRGLPAKDVGHGTYRIVPPSEALARINADLIAHQGRTTRFATAVYCTIDCVTGRARLSSAGHPAPVILRADGALETIDAGGGLLGVFDGEQYPEVEVELGPGDRLLLYSDGFEQAFPGDPTGARHARTPSKRYLEEFAALRSAPDVAAMVEQVGRRVDMQFGSVHQADDLTLVAVERITANAGAG